MEEEEVECAGVLSVTFMLLAGAPSPEPPGTEAHKNNFLGLLIGFSELCSMTDLPQPKC